MFRRLVTSAALSIALVTSALAADGKTHRVAIQVDQNDPAVMNMVLNNATNVIEYYRGKSEDVDVEIVAYGPGIELLRSESPARKQVESLISQGVRFDVCLNTVDTIERETGRRPEIIPAATPVQVGVGQILFLTENGYTLVRP